MTRRTRSVALTAAAAALAMLTAACSSSAASGPAGGSGAAGDDSGVAAATAALTAGEKEPTSIGPLEPLPKAPETGIKVALVTSPLSESGGLNDAFKEAAQALGWSPTVVTYDVNKPGEAFQQAINSGYKYIGLIAVQIDQVKPQLADAKSKGIAVFGAYTTDQPQGEANGLYGEALGKDAVAANGALAANFITADSNGNANVLYAFLPIYQGWVVAGQGAKDELAKNCSSCSYDELGLNANQLGSGQAPTAIVAYLQSHPDVNYVLVPSPAFDTGLLPALRAARLDKKVKIVGLAGATAQMKAVQDGTAAAWTAFPNTELGWILVDWMARQSLGVLTPDALSATDGSMGNNQFIVHTADAAAAQLKANNGIWPGPADFQGQFKKLWLV